MVIQGDPSMTSGNAWLVCREPVHIGGADSDSRGNNNPIYRLPDRTPVIPGSSLRGALREHAESDPATQRLVANWFGGSPDAVAPGNISLGWGWPVWWPVHVLGYGNWWVSCPAWLQRYCSLTQQPEPTLRHPLLISDSALNNETVYLRWVKLDRVQFDQDSATWPLPPELESYRNRLLIVPNDSINVLVEMGLVHQPRVSLKDEPDENGNLVENLFAAEGMPPGAAFLLSWTTRNKVSDLTEWEQFLHQEHHLGGLWSVGYGRISIEGL